MKTVTQNPNLNEILYQTNPIKEKRNRYRLPDGRLPKEKSWVDSLASYETEANQLTRCLVANREMAGENYTWLVTINFRVFLAPAKIKAVWRKSKEKLYKNGLVACWILEYSKNSNVHFHLLVRSKHSEEELKDLIESSLPNRRKIPWHKNIKPVKKPPRKQPDRLLYYITKARLSKRTPAGARPILDRYAAKRRLQKPGVGMRKFGTIGRFWVTPKKKIWAEISAVEKQIALGLSQPNVAALAERVSEFLGEEQNVVTREQIRRKFGYHWDSNWIQTWIHQIYDRAPQTA